MFGCNEAEAAVGTFELEQAEQLVLLALFSSVHTEHDQSPKSDVTFIGEIPPQAEQLVSSSLFSNVHFGHDHEVGEKEEVAGGHCLDPEADSNLRSRASLTKSLSRLLVEGGRFLFADIVAATLW